MFVVTEADAAAIRAVYQQRGEFPAAVELRRRFPGITDNAQARMWARTIAGWKPGRSAAATAGEADARWRPQPADVAQEGTDCVVAMVEY